MLRFYIIFFLVLKSWIVLVPYRSLMSPPRCGNRSTEVPVISTTRTFYLQTNICVNELSSIKFCKWFLKFMQQKIKHWSQHLADTYRQYMPRSLKRKHKLTVGLHIYLHPPVWLFNLRNNNKPSPPVRFTFLPATLFWPFEETLGQSCDFGAVTWTTSHCPLICHQVVLCLTFRRLEEQTLRLLNNSGVKYISWSSQYMKCISNDICLIR